MNQAIGMDPERVDSSRFRAMQSISQIDSAARTARNAAWASLNPLSYAIQPGGFIIAPFSIGATQVAAALAEQAARDAEALLSRLSLEVAEQRNASNGGTFRGVSVSRVAKSGVPKIGSDPEEVAEWWADLPDAEKERLIVENPELLGNLDGLPNDVRNEANRAVLDNLLADPQLSDEDRTRLQSIKDELDATQKVYGDDQVIQLVLLDWSDEDYPKVAISIGDSDSADFVAPMAFGINTGIDDLDGSMKAARSLHQEQQELIDQGLAKGETAVVMWLGYDSGDTSTVTHDDKAIKGGDDFTRYLAGLRAQNPDTYLAPVVHSYGTRMLSHSLSNGGQADVAVLLGSPGVADTVTHASQMDTVDGVYASRAKTDMVANQAYKSKQWLDKSPGGKNPDPASDDWGAKKFSTSTQRFDGLGHSLFADDGKGGYLNEGSTGLRNSALITLNRGDLTE